MIKASLTTRQKREHVEFPFQLLEKRKETQERERERKKQAEIFRSWELKIAEHTDTHI